MRLRLSRIFQILVKYQLSTFRTLDPQIVRNIRFLPNALKFRANNIIDPVHFDTILLTSILQMARSNQFTLYYLAHGGPGLQSAPSDFPWPVVNKLPARRILAGLDFDNTPGLIFHQCVYLVN